MPLVPPSTYAAWFRKDSAVFRSFQYLFVNPLWQKRVPSGFSLCPYWWAAVFSLAIFRPLVFAVLGFRAVVRTVGLSALIRWTDSLASRVIGIKEAPFAASTVLGLVFLLGASMPFVGLYQLYIAAAEIGMRSALLLPVGLFATCLACGSYAKRHEHDDNRCRVEWYVRLAALVAVVSAYILHPDYAATAFVGYPLLAVAKVAWAIKVAVLAVCGWIGSAFAWMSAFALFGVSTLYIALAGLVVMALYGWIVIRFFPNLGFGPLAQASDSPASRTSTKENVALIAGYLRTNAEFDFAIYESHEHWVKVVRRTPAAMALAEAGVSVASIQMRGLYPALFATHAAIVKEAVAKATRCHAWSNRVAVVFAPAAALCAAIWKQVRVASSYAWALVKAVKGKNCPYLRFED